MEISEIHIKIFVLLSFLITCFTLLLIVLRRYRNSLLRFKDIESVFLKQQDEIEHHNKQQQSILNHIIKCANQAIGNDNSVFESSMQELAAELRKIFGSEYCAIGTFCDDIAKDRVIDFKKSTNKAKSEKQINKLHDVQSAHISDKDCKVCIALKDTSKRVSNFSSDDINKNGVFYKSYINILDSREVKNTTIIPIREDKNNYGYIQFINTTGLIKYIEFAPFMKAFIGLTQLIISRDRNELERKKNEKELAKAQNRAKDTKFYNEIQSKFYNEVQSNKDNIDELLDIIMEYFSNEFNAAVISFRIPIISVNQDNAIFYLRRCYINSNVKDYQGLVHRYEQQRALKCNFDLGGNVALKCKYIKNNKDIISCAAGDTDYYDDYGLDIYEQTFLMPILRDNNQNEEKCPNKTCELEENNNCISKFKDYYGVFRLRISKSKLDDSQNEFILDDEDIKQRLSYLSNQVTLLLNTIVEKHKTKSLEVFQNGLKNSSFVKIQDFDERCVNILKESVGAKACSIYRYDKTKKQLKLSATTAKTIRFGNELNLDVESNKKKCSISTETKNNILTKTFETKSPTYIYDIYDAKTHQSPFIENTSGNNNSAISVPLVKKNGETLGVVLLLGKEKPNQLISTAYWEHDVNYIEFIVNTLARISESDNERLTFLSQLSHELLSPVTEMVYENDYILNLAEYDPKSITRQQLIKTISNNMDTCMLLKYIIINTESRYAPNKNSTGYNIVKHDRPQDILLDAIRLLEKEAHGKGLIIRTNISKMPPIYFDKERMMQVFLNLLKNAIRYSDNYSIIDIYYKQDNIGFHEIRFANYGIGIQEEEREKIFDLFYRGKEAKSKNEHGTGLGLYIVRDIMRTHGGDCYVRNLKDPTEFVVTLPNK